MAKKISKKLVGRTTPRKLSAEGKPFKGGFKKTNEQGLNAWNTGKNMIFHGVKAAGKSFPSLYQAFVELKLPIGSHKTFRKALKVEGRKVYETEAGKKITFTLTL